MDKLPAVDIYQNLSSENSDQRITDLTDTTDLLRSQLRFQTVAQHTHDGLLIIDSNFKIIYFNNEFCRLLGRKEDELFNQDFRNFLDHDTSRMIGERYKRRQMGEDLPARYQFTLLNKKGEKRYIEIDSTVVNDIDGKIITISHLLDITEKQNALHSLNESESRFRMLVSQSPFAMQIFNTEGVLVEANKAWGNLWGVNNIDAYCENYNIFDDKQASTLGYIEAFKDAGGGLPTDLPDYVFIPHNIASPQHIRWLQSRFFPIKNQNDQIINIVATHEDITARKNAEEALRQSEDKYITIFNHAPVGILHIDRKGILTNCNEKLCRILRSSKDHLIGKKLTAKMPNPQIVKAIEATLNSGAGFFEGLFKNADSGKVVPLKIYLNAIYDSRKIIGAVGIINDITEKHQYAVIRDVVHNISKTALTANNTYELSAIIHMELHRIINTTNFYIGLYDKATDTISFPYMQDENDKYQHVPAKGTLSSLVIKNERPLLVNSKQINDLEKKDKIYKIGTTCKCWLGVPLQVDKEVIGIIVVQSYKDDNAYSDSDLLLLEFVANQVAFSVKHRQANDEIRKLSLSVEQSSVSVVITDPEGNIEYVNRKFSEVSGYSREEVIGKNPRILKSDETPPETFKQLWANITSGKEWRGEFINWKKSGETYCETAMITPIKDDRGRITHYLAIKEDVTERKILEQQLHQAQKMESIGTLAGGISHDFNNLLTVINGHAELAMRKLDSENPLHGDIVSIIHAGKRAENLTRQLLAFSRKQVFKPKIVRISEIIIGLDKMVQRLIGEDIRIIKILDRKSCVIKADPSQVEQIFLNLLINARDAINEKSGSTANKEITIETELINLTEEEAAVYPGAVEGKYVCFSVTDNGAGIPAEIREKIFEPFFTTKEKNSGTGLGLATVYGIVKQNQGMVYVDSEIGKGATFRVFWPFSDERPDEETQLHIPSTKMTGKERILLVEDDDAVRDLSVAALKELGYQVYDSSTGKKALEFLHTFHETIDMVITDMVMPEMNGTELAKNIKLFFPETKIIFSSGYAHNKLTESGQLSKDIEYLQKPYSIQTFAVKIREVFDQS